MRAKFFLIFFLMIRRPPRSTLDRSSAASDVYKRQAQAALAGHGLAHGDAGGADKLAQRLRRLGIDDALSLIHISEPTRPY